MIRPEYDIVVVGGGPAGTTAARKAAEKGAKVALFHRNNEIGSPVRCAEGIAKKLLEKYIGKEKIRKSWIAAEINQFRFISPSLKKVDLNLKQTGYVLNRRVFDADLADWAAQTGVSIFSGAYVFAVEKGAESSFVLVSHYGKVYRVKCKLVIAADGVESRIAEYFGLNTRLKPVDIDSCVQASVSNIEMDEQRIEFWVSSTLAPGGYIWLFPKGKGKANIGIGISGTHNRSVTIRNNLEKFLAMHFPEASLINYISGGVPIAMPLDSFVADGLMVVGDAARVANPTTGEGIAPALSTGSRAGIVAANAVEKNDFSATYLKAYEKDWRKDSGRFHKFYYNMKTVIYNIKDEEYDKLAEKFQDRDPESLTIREIFSKLLWNKPKLLIDITRAFAGF